MEIQIAGNCLYCSQPLLPHCSTLSAKRRGILGSLSRQINHPLRFLRTTSAKLSRKQSLEDPKRSRRRSVGRSLQMALSANMDGGFADDGEHEEDEEFVRQLQELALQLQDDSNNCENVPDPRNQEAESTSSASPLCVRNEFYPFVQSPWPAIHPEQPKWDEIAPAGLEMKANSVDHPLSLRMLKQKKRWEERFKEADESAYDSIKKAFSSMVFIVRELQSYTLKMREILYYENIQGILARVQGEINASFVWLFQQIYSCTPTFMVYVMLFLANFTVYSIGHSSAVAAVVSSNPPAAVEQQYQQLQHHQQKNSRFDATSIKSFSVDRTASFGGNGSGGGRVKPVAGATDDGRSDSFYNQTVIPAEGISKVGVEGSEMAMDEDGLTMWNRIMAEAYSMRGSSRDESLMDLDTLRQLVSPVTVELEPEDYAVYSRTELMYHQALSQDPNNVLLLSNFAQFLFLVLHDHDRAEYYFKRAAGVKPADAEALCRYAVFLWLVRKDLEAAENAYVEAMAAADASNASHYAANYAHFLWNTGGEETCYPHDGRDVC